MQTRSNVKWFWIVILAGLLLQPAWAGAVAPGGVYTKGETMSLVLDDKLLPHRLGFHVVRGSSIYHGRSIPFLTGIFLPPAFFHAKEPMPVVMALHNRAAIGDTSGSAMSGEGMGRVLTFGGQDNRAEGVRSENPISLRKDAEFIGIVPQCPAGLNWEDPAIANLLCKVIAKVVAVYHADDDRVYLTGFSYGASSTWRVALMAPDRFAAIVVCDGRASPDPARDVEKLKNVAVYLEVGQWDGPFDEEANRMHQALNSLPHRDFIFRMISGGNHFCYQTVYDDPLVWKWVFSKRRHS